MKHIEMKRIIIAVASFLLTHSAQAQKDSAIINGKLTLQQAMEIAFANNVQVKQNEFQSEINQVNLQQAKDNRLPNLFGNAIQGLNLGRSIDPFTNSYINQEVGYSNFGLNASVNLFNGFLLQNTVKQNGLIYEAGKMDLQQAKDNLSLNIVLAYLQVLSNEDLLSAARNQAEVTAKQVARLEIMNKEGAIAPATLYDMKGQYASDQVNIVNAENAVAAAKISLFQWMYIPYKKDVELERVQLDVAIQNYPLTSDSIYQTALDKLALIKATNLRKKSAEQGVKVAQSYFYPTLSLNGGVFSNYSSAATNAIFLNSTDVASNNYIFINGNKTMVYRPQDNYNYQKIAYTQQLKNNFNSAVSLSLRVPIFNSMFAKNQVKLAKIAVRSANFTAKSTQTQLQQLIDQAYQNMMASYNRYQPLQNQVDAYKESFRSAEIRFNAGASTPVEYIIAKNNIDRANINLTAAKYDFIFRSKILDFYQGKPLW